MTGVWGTHPEAKPARRLLVAAILFSWAPFSGTVRGAAASWVSEIL